MATAVGLAHLQIRALPDLPARTRAEAELVYRPVLLPPVDGALRLAGAWELTSPDRRLGGLSGLAIDGGRLLAVSDRGAVVRFDGPAAPRPAAWLADLRDGPSPWGEKWSRDAESIAPDPEGRGWWIGYEQNHSLFLYSPDFASVLLSIDLGRRDWSDNRGAEGLLVDGNNLLVMAENGREAIRVDDAALERVKLQAGAEVAEAARAPDGSAWLLLRAKGIDGINQSIAPLVRTDSGYRAGPALAVPKGAFDNYEGMAIERRPHGGWRFWLISDDGHRLMARTLLVALDYNPPGHDKSPAQGTGLSKERKRKKA